MQRLPNWKSWFSACHVTYVIRFTKEADDCETDFERWLYLLKHMDTLDRMPFKAQKAVFDKLLAVADVANLSKEERIQYDEALKRYRDYKNTIDYAEERGIKKGFEQGIEKGLKQGMKQGKEQGMKQGLKQGHNEGLCQTALNMKTMQLPLEVIMQATGLTESEIQTL